MRKVIFIILFTIVSLSTFATDGNGGVGNYSLRSDGKLMSVSLNVYTQSISIKFTQTNSNIDNIVVMNLVGRKVGEQKYVQGTEQLLINSSKNLPSGIYVILARDAQGKIIESAKITINK